MSEAIKIALITLMGTVASGLFSVLITNGIMKSLINYRLDELEKKQDKHNSIIERTYHLEEETSVLRTEINNLKREVEK